MSLGFCPFSRPTLVPPLVLSRIFSYGRELARNEFHTKSAIKDTTQKTFN